MDQEGNRQSEKEKIACFCKDPDYMRLALAITYQGRRWRLYAAFLGIATKPICSGETESFVFSWEGVLFKVYSKGFIRVDQEPQGIEIQADPVAKTIPPYPGDLQDDPAFDSMIYAAQVSQRTRETHVIYVDWRAAHLLEAFLREWGELICDLEKQAQEAAVKAIEDGKLVTLPTLLGDVIFPAGVAEGAPLEEVEPDHE